MLNVGPGVLEGLFSQLWIAWQPICNLRSDTVWGYEALIRGPEGSPFESPSELFELARSEGMEEELEELCRSLAFRAAARDLPARSVLFVNANPRFLGLPMDPESAGWSIQRTVIEISEGYPLFDDPEALQSQIATWRAQGFRIALDDFGSGFAGQSAILAVRPDIVKIDIRFVHGIDRDPWRQEIVSSMVHVSSDLGIATVAEGIETAEELNEVVLRGISLGQGFLLGSPARKPQSRLPVDGQSVFRQDAEALLDAAMPATGASYAVDRARRIVRWNDEAAEVSGHPAQALVGATCWLSGLDHRDAAGARLCFRACPLVTAMHTGKTQSGVVSLRTGSGGRRWVETKVEPVFDSAGRAVGAVEVFAPVPRPQEAAQEPAWMRSAGGGLPAAPWLQDSQALHWRREIARWLAAWRSGDSFPSMAQRLVHSLPFGNASIWRPQANARHAAVAAKGDGEQPAIDMADLASEARTERRTVRWSNEGADPDPAAEARVAIAIPLMHRGDVEGVLVIGVDDAQRIPPPAVDSLEEVAPLLGALIANQILLDSLRQQGATLQWMRTAAPTAMDWPQGRRQGAYVPSRSVWQRFRRGWERAVDVRGGVMLIKEQREDSWTILDTWGSYAPWVQDEEELVRVLSSIWVDMPHGGWIPGDHPLQCGDLPCYAHPIWDGDEAIAVLLIAAGSRELGDALIPVLEFASLATVSRRRQRELLRIAREDPLTGALNRRALEERLEAYLRRRSPEPTLFLLWDVDDLKRINDSQGHQNADALLREFADYARSVLRSEDDVARIGGDEFVWLLHGAAWGAGTKRRLQEILDASPLGKFGTGSTVGVVELPREAETYADAYRLADRRLYHGKKSGKGQVVGDEADAPSQATGEA